jgi:hypothetical protein
MKKVVALVLLSMLTAGPAFAASLAATASQAGYVLTSTAPASTTIAKTSKNVRIGAQYSGTGYAINTFHQSGTKHFGTAYDATAIYVNDVGAGWTGFAAPSSSVASEAFTGTGWSTL